MFRLLMAHMVKQTHSRCFPSMCLLVCFQNEAVTAFKKARQQYFQRCDELEKAKAVTAKAVDDTAGMKTLDKRRKSKDEAQTKVKHRLFFFFFCFIVY